LVAVRVLLCSFRFVGLGSIPLFAALRLPFVYGCVHHIAVGCTLVRLRSGLRLVGYRLRFTFCVCVWFAFIYVTLVTSDITRLTLGSFVFVYVLRLVWFTLPGLLRTGSFTFRFTGCVRFAVWVSLRSVWFGLRLRFVCSVVHVGSCTLVGSVLPHVLPAGLPIARFVAFRLRLPVLRHHTRFTFYVAFIAFAFTFTFPFVYPVGYSVYGWFTFAVRFLRLVGFVSFSYFGSIVYRFRFTAFPVWVTGPLFTGSFTFGSLLRFSVCLLVYVHLLGFPLRYVTFTVGLRSSPLASYVPHRRCSTFTFTVGLLYSLVRVGYVLLLLGWFTFTFTFVSLVSSCFCVTFL